MQVGSDLPVLGGSTPKKEGFGRFAQNLVLPKSCHLDNYCNIDNCFNIGLILLRVLGSASLR
eukprot:5698565-Amphidinium_carterae.1